MLGSKILGTYTKNGAQKNNEYHVEFAMIYIQYVIVSELK